MVEQRFTFHQGSAECECVRERVPATGLCPIRMHMYDEAHLRIASLHKKNVLCVCLCVCMLLHVEWESFSNEVKRGSIE